MNKNKYTYPLGLRMRGSDLYWESGPEWAVLLAWPFPSFPLYFLFPFDIVFSLSRSFPDGSVAKNLPANAGAAGDVCFILGSRDPLEKEMATHSSMLAWKIWWTEEPGGVQSQRVRHDWATEPLTHFFYQLLLILLFNQIISDSGIYGMLWRPVLSTRLCPSKLQVNPSSNDSCSCQRGDFYSHL